MDLTFLQTLPQREFCNGMAEVIKTGVIRDAHLFDFLETAVEGIMNQRDAKLLQEIVLRSARIKSEVVTMDAREDGIRCILNYGHTIGHAIEAMAFPLLLHGECVSIGMVLETKLSQKMNHLKNSGMIGRLIRCLQAYHLPVQIPKKKKTSEASSSSANAITEKKGTLDITPQDLINKMLLDKKNASNSIRCVIVKDIGEVFEYPVPVSQEELKQVLLPQISVVPAQVNGEITVPGSKSISNRVLALASLGQGKRFPTLR
jgi:pentafunctional AROM polypeptide